MIKPPLPPDEAERLADLHELAILDTDPEERFDRITRLTQRLFDVPIALISLVDADRQWFKSCQGLSDSETPRDISFCGHAILDDDVMVIPDTQLDPRFSDNPLVTGHPNIRFYAGQPLRGRDGHNVGVLCIKDHRPRQMGATDLQALRDLAIWAEHELSAIELSRAVTAERESRERIRAIVDTAVDGIITIDERGVVESLNPASERMFGYAADEVIGRNVSMLMPAPFRGVHDGYLANFLRTGEKKIIGIGREVMGQRKDGTTFPMDLAVSAVRLGERRMFTGIVRDITERKRAEEVLARNMAELAGSNAKLKDFERFFDLSIDMLCIAGLDGYFKLVNPAWEATLGFTREEIVSRPFINLVHPDDREATNETYATQIEQGKDIVEFENRYLCKDGSYKWLLWNAKTVTELELIYAVARDVTERKRAEEELARRAEALTRSNEELEDFTHVVSHDLKEPLRIIEAFSSFLAEEYAEKVEGEGKRYIEILQENARRMRDLIDDLLQLSRLSTVKPEPIMVDMAALLREVHKEIEFALSEKNAELRIASDAPSVECDRVRIKQVLENLISNAIKYNDKEKPVIEVGWQEGEGLWMFFVRDNGPGIEERYHQKIFGIFERLVHREEQTGTGIGLTICKKILELHGGKIWVESKGRQRKHNLLSLPRMAGDHGQVREARNGRQVTVVRILLLRIILTM